MSNKCGECEDYYCCKSDSKLRAKYLPKNKKACRDFTPSREYLQSEVERLKARLQTVKDNINFYGKCAKRTEEINKALKGGGQAEAKGDLTAKTTNGAMPGTDS